jgi:hypothetical protein
MTSRNLQVKDADGLTLVQRRLLQELALTADWRQACANAEVPANTLRHLLSTNVAFVDAYNKLLGPAVEVARDMMESTAVKAAGMYEEAVEAVRMVELEIVCPECKHEFSTTNPYPDWATRLRAGDTVLKVTKLLKDVKEISGSITHLNMEQSLALAKARYHIRRGEDPGLSPALMEMLRPHLQEENPHENAPDKVIDVGSDGVRPVDGDDGGAVPKR